MKLNTLKDIRKDRIKYFKKKLESFGCPDSYLEQTAKSMALFLEKQEKQEAIKRIKKIRKDFEEGTAGQTEDYNFMDFFNITEEDLK